MTALTEPHYNKVNMALKLITPPTTYPVTLVKTKERAPVGATCDLTRPTKQRGKDLYAPYDSTSLVALCSKR